MRYALHIMGLIFILEGDNARSAGKPY